jgi:hypothetical protein
MQIGAPAGLLPTAAVGAHTIEQPAEPVMLHLDVRFHIKPGKSNLYVREGDAFGGGTISAKRYNPTQERLHLLSPPAREL